MRYKFLTQKGVGNAKKEKQHTAEEKNNNYHQ